MPFKMLGLLASVEPDLGASASGWELRGRVTGSPGIDNCGGYTVVSSIVSPYNYLRAPKH